MREPMTDQERFNIAMIFGWVMFLAGTFGITELALGVLVAHIVANVEYWMERKQSERS